MAQIARQHWSAKRYAETAHLDETEAWIADYMRLRFRADRVG